MTLSEDEQHKLDEIETFTRSADPRFAANLDLASARRRRMALSGSAFWFGLVILMVGMSAARGPISIGVLVGSYGLILMVWATVTAQRNRIRRKGHPTGDPNPENPDHR